MEKLTADRHMLLLRNSLLVAAVVCMGIGVARGEHQMLLEKAVRICLECIGIG